MRAIAGYLITKRGLAKALIDSLGRDSELISVCSMRMRDTLDRLLGHAQEAGVLRADVTAHDVLRLVHGIVMATEQSPQDTDRLLGMMLDGLRTSAAGRFALPPEQACLRSKHCLRSKRCSRSNSPGAAEPRTRSG